MKNRHLLLLFLLTCTAKQTYSSMLRLIMKTRPQHILIDPNQGQRLSHAFLTLIIER